MSNYLVFSGNFYYPRGCWSDFVGQAATLEEARKLVPPNTDWWEIVYDYEVLEGG